MPRKKPVSAKFSNSKSINQDDKKAILNSQNSNLTRYERLNKFLDLHLNKIFWVSFGLTLLSGLLLFDIRITLAGDDSAYIIRASDFIQHFMFPGFQGPLYPIILSPFIGLFGINVVLLKSISLIFILGFTWIIFKAFRNRVPSLLLTSMLFLISVNSFILYYASQTYSEALFMIIQALTFLVFFTWFIDEKKKVPVPQFQKHFVLALCVLGLVLTRSIGLAAVFAISGYFLFKGQWKNLFGFGICFVLVVAVFEAFKYLIWKSTDINFTFQAQSLMAKDYYDPAMGRENVMGILNRFISNSNLYLSNFLFAIIGLYKSDSFQTTYTNINAVYPVVTILTSVMLIASVMISFRKNSYMFFTGLYTLAFLFFTFLIVNTYWGQDRFIIPYIPFILLMLLAFFYFILEFKQLKSFKIGLPVLILVLFFLAIHDTVPVIASSRQIINQYSGLSPEWENYCRISEWASGNLPKDALVACRKPSISFVYGHGKQFYGIMRVPSVPGDSFFANWQQKHLQYSLIFASSFNNRPVSNALYATVKKSTVGLGITNDELGNHKVKFCILDIPDSIRLRTLDELNNARIEPVSDLKTLKNMMNDKSLKISIVFPDSLLQTLVKARVTHVLTANLSTYKTIERYIAYIEFKYPKIRTKIKQIGDDNDAPAAIYKLNLP